MAIGRVLLFTILALVKSNFLLFIFLPVIYLYSMVLKRCFVFNLLLYTVSLFCKQHESSHVCLVFCFCQWKMFCQWIVDQYENNWVLPSNSPLGLSLCHLSLLEFNISPLYSNRWIVCSHIEGNISFEMLKADREKQQIIKWVRFEVELLRLLTHLYKIL